MIERTGLLYSVRSALKRSRIVMLIGPRQCGKTTLSRDLAEPDSLNYFDLEDPTGLARLDEPMTALRHLKGLVVIDEIQRRPELFPVLRVLADRKPLPSRFLILGSASRDLLRQSSESLAGRVETITMGGFSLSEVGPSILRRHWLRGGFPRSFLARTELDSLAWRKNFIQTFVERDLPQWGKGIPAPALLSFWTMLAHYHGQTWNAAEPARSLGLSEPTVRRYLDILTGVFMIRQLQPWHANLKKRQVKAPKIFFRDTGLLHQLLGIRSEKDLLSHPKCGASWEGYVIEEILKAAEPEEAYYWATHSGAEIDLVLIKNGRMYGVECKRMDAPALTPSMRNALEDLNLKQIAVVYPGTKRYPLGKAIHVVPLEAVAEGMKGLFPTK
ncbi:MAG: hypothetical protein A2W23_03730 [Planctomycetes bacterium RBG_16_43_13]|nr:MAG: hypothetical protein A2W23_03730 [Planctomycetes bacterium RBG_16_43_13]